MRSSWRQCAGFSRSPDADLSRQYVAILFPRKTANPAYLTRKRSCPIRPNDVRCANDATAAVGDLLKETEFNEVIYCAAICFIGLGVRVTELAHCRVGGPHHEVGNVSCNARDTCLPEPESTDKIGELTAV